MRSIVIDQARKAHAARHGGDVAPLPLEAVDLAVEDQAATLLTLDEALHRLGAFHPRWARIVEYRFFGGLTIAETAEMLNLSLSTIKKEWSFAKAWLYSEMKGA